MASTSVPPIGRSDGEAMRAAAGLVLASGVQGGHAPATAGDTLLIALLIGACGLIFTYLVRRARRPKDVGDEWRALAVMGELCPHGWQAQITLYGCGAPVPEDAPPSRVPLVELEWKQFEEETGQVTVARRAWAPTIARALQSMVDDRLTDLTLEQIEQGLDEQEDAW